ncbi:dynamin family protein [Vitreimonas flagellata]|uniref:dynamin family protein n=1 Tax=Vitreimonas flagellata TaxID=2560861 RepID=UPI0014304C97|nr:dynamin family protein [Vitreimonas flagellata]
MLDLSTDLRTLRKHALELGLSGVAREIASVLDRLEKNKFAVAVVGEFKRGKSTFINALLGVSVLPTDVLPCSAALNRVTYSIEKRVTVTYKDGRVEDIPYDSLPSYVTKLTEQSEAVAATLAEATVYYPSPYCQNNVDVIDTPGLNEDQAMTAVTLGVLPQVDAAIMVIMAQSPFSDFEREFLEDRLLSVDLGRVIFVVNGLDRLNSPDEAKRLLEGVEGRIKRNVFERAKRQFGADSNEYETYLRKIGAPKVFGLSAREAIEAKKSGDTQRLERSGFPQFELQLEKFLTEHRGVIMLQVPLNRCIASVRDILETLALREAALTLEVEDFDRAMAESTTMIEKARERWAQERMAMVDAGNVIRKRAGDMGVLFMSKLPKAVEAAIQALAIDNDNLSGDARKTLDKRVQALVTKTTSEVMDAFAMELQSEVEGAINREAARLNAFDVQLSSLMSEVGKRFQQFDTEDKSTKVTEGVLAGVAVWSGFGGIWSGYQSAGWKGAGVGLGASIGTAVLGFAGAAALGLGAAFVFPVAILVGVASIFTGRWLSDALFQESRVQNYKENAIKTVRKHIERDLGVDVVTLHFQDAATGAFEAFRKSVSEASEAKLNDTTQQLHETRELYSRSRQSKERDQVASRALHAELQEIASRAFKLSHQLVVSEGI